MNAAMSTPYEHQADQLTDADAGASERDYAAANHLVGLTALLDLGAIIGLISTIILWRIRSGDSPFLDDHGREAVNFQLSLLAYIVVGAAAGAAFAIVTLGIGLIVIAPLLGLGWVFLLVLRIVGAVRGGLAARRGQFYRYPMCIRFLQGPAEA